MEGANDLPHLQLHLINRQCKVLCLNCGYTLT